jgi:uncharacterized protein (UPF0335 family)
MRRFPVKPPRGEAQPLNPSDPGSPIIRVDANGKIYGAPSDMTPAVQFMLRAFVGRLDRIDSKIEELNLRKASIFKEARNLDINLRALRDVMKRRRIGIAMGAERLAELDFKTLQYEAVVQQGVFSASGVLVNHGSDGTYVKPLTPMPISLDLQALGELMALTASEAPDPLDS